MRPVVVVAVIVALVAVRPVWADVRLDGVKGRIADNVRAYLRLDDEPCDQDPVRVRYRYEQAPRDIREALKPFGYYQPSIESTLTLNEDREQDCWRAVFRIDPGEPVLIDSVDVDVRGEGSSLPVFQRLLADTGLKTGAQLRHSDYETLKDALLVAAREYGFFDARLIRHDIRVDRGRYSASINLVMDTGERYRFGDLDVSSGADVLNRELLVRYADFNAGAPFEQRRLRKLQNDLVASDYFSVVDVRTRPREDDKTVDVRVILEASRRIRYGIGIGYGTDTGPVVRGDFSVRRLNRAGHRLGMDTELSEVTQNVSADYRVPGKRPQSDWYSFYGGVNRENSDAIENVAVKVGVRQNIFHTVNWSSTPFIELLVGRSKQNGAWTQQMSLVPGWGVHYVTANVPVRPTHGLRFKAEAATAIENVLSDASFLRLDLEGKTILPLSERGRLLLRSEVGWMATNDFENVPPAWRFFAGGDRSVRGYDYQSLGPQDDAGKSLGGRLLLTASVESDWRFLARWSAAVFVDAGNVGDEHLLDNLPWSIGAGVRWYSPVGPIRLDLAFPQEGGNSFRIHISMGPDL
ncbi:MAG: outer membrane protein assembly factor [Pseudomonadales bacterium]|jgi:translocation and assembly module TamA